MLHRSRITLQNPKVKLNSESVKQLVEPFILGQEKRYVLLCFQVKDVVHQTAENQDVTGTRVLLQLACYMTVYTPELKHSREGGAQKFIHSNFISRNRVKCYMTVNADVGVCKVPPGACNTKHIQDILNNVFVYLV